MIALALAIPWVTAALVALADGRQRWVGVVVAVALAATLAVLGVLAVGAFTGSPAEVVTGGWPVGVGIRLQADPAGLLLALLSLSVLLAALVDETLAGIRARTFPALVAFLAAGLTGLFLTADVFDFYVFFEVSMASSFGLAGYGGGRAESRAALAFMVVNLVGSVLFLVGVVSLYHLTGTLDVHLVAAALDRAPARAVLVDATVLFVAFSLKLGLFPFHFWLPGVYRAVSPPVAAILAGAVANIGGYGLIRFGTVILPGAVEEGRLVLWILGSASVLYGSLVALVRRSGGDTLAYSAIGQAGYVLLGLAAGGPLGFAAALIAAFGNGLGKGLLFLCLGRRSKAASIAAAVGALSVAGIPPAAGFLTKLELFRAGAAAGSALLGAVVAVGSVLAIAYMFRFHQRAYWEERSTLRATGAAWAPAALAAVTVVLGLWPGPLLAAARIAADFALGGAR